MNAANQKKWDGAAATFDFMAGFGEERRWRPYKTKLFSSMGGKVLFLAVGTGLDIPSFPRGRTITGIDISAKMLEKAAPRVAAYDGEMTTRQMDVHNMTFDDDTFDQVFTSCTFCSVPDPIDGLRALRRVLKPGGRLGMFEHTGSRQFPFGLMLNAMNPIMRKLGSEIDRNTVANVRAAGYHIDAVTNIFLDVVKTIEATNPK
jgi:ubiquinone/menaquinone biosynthesis C-methylase UbiE